MLYCLLLGNRDDLVSFRGGKGDYRAAAYRGILTDSQPV